MTVLPRSPWEKLCAAVKSAFLPGIQIPSIPKKPENKPPTKEEIIVMKDVYGINRDA